MIDTFFEFCYYAVSHGFWVFLGCVLLLGIPINFVYRIYAKTFQHFVDMKHGHPVCKSKDNDDDAVV